MTYTNQDITISLNALVNMIRESVQPQPMEAQPLPHAQANYSGMVGEYVIVRCSDAGVHAGYLQNHQGRECVLTSARRLWYWKPADGAKFLSGVAARGLSPDSKVSEEVSRILLTENCEIILCSQVAANSIKEIKPDAN